MFQCNRGHGSIPARLRVTALSLSAVLLVGGPSETGATTDGATEPGLAWYSMALGYGSLTQRSAAGSRRRDAFAMDFLWGVPVTSQVRCGVKLGGWTIDAFDPVSGRSFWNFLAIADVQPHLRGSPFLRIGGGLGAFYDQAAIARASGWAGTVGLGWDLAPQPRYLAPLVIEYSWGRPGDAARSNSSFQHIRYRVVSVTLALGGIAFPPPVAEAPASNPFSTMPVGVRIQGGGHTLTRSLGILPPGVVDGQEDGRGILAGFGLQVERGRSRRYGVGLELEGNKVEIGPQTFGIATVRMMAKSELAWPFLEPRGRHDWRPYFLLGAGWNFNSAGTNTIYPLGAPSGTATALDINGSPTLELGLGMDSPINRNFALNFEAGWHWNTAGYRMAIEGSPDRTGDAHLSGLFVLVGIGLGRPHGSR